MTTDDLSAGSGPAEQVSALLLDSLLALPLQTLLAPKVQAPLLRAALCRLLRSPGALPGSGTGLDALTAQAARWLRAQATLRQAIPPSLIELMRELLRRPYVPDRGLMLGLMSVPPLRTLTRELMVGTLLDYGRKLRAATTEPAAGAKGAGAAPKGGLLGRLATEAVRKGGAAAQALAPGVTSLVTDELERQMQRRATEFADGSVDELLQRAAATLTDPQRAAEQTAVKLAVLDYMLERRGSELAQELLRLEPHAVSELLRQALLRFLESDTGEADLAAILQGLSEAAASKPALSLGALLESAGALSPVREALLLLFRQVTGPVLANGALQKALGPAAG